LQAENTKGKSAVRKPLRNIQRSQEKASHPVGDPQFQSVAFLSKSLSDENRLRILACVSQGKKSVTGIVEVLGLSQPLVSHHLKELKRSLLVKIERSGPFIYYELSDPRIMDVVSILDIVASDLLSSRKSF
jgi:DNA-binding transcriptional ArsR family regulator